MSEHAQWMPDVWRGSSGGAVITLQTSLNALGAKPKLTIDGDFGPVTEGAVLAFQRKRKLKADGIVGPITWGRVLDAPKAE